MNDRNRARQIFEEAIEFTERTEWLGKQCGDDPELLAAVTRLGVIA